MKTAMIERQVLVLDDGDGTRIIELSNSELHTIRAAVRMRAEHFEAALESCYSDPFKETIREPDGIVADYLAVAQLFREQAEQSRVLLEKISADEEVNSVVLTELQRKILGNLSYVKYTSFARITDSLSKVDRKAISNALFELVNSQMITKDGFGAYQKVKR